MITKYIIGAAVGISIVAGAWWHGNYHGKQSAELHTAKAWLDSAEVARDIQEKRQDGVNDALRKQNENLAGINARQLATIERLQQRPDRYELPESSRAECKGSTGAELSREDGQFLAGEASRADRIRAALMACYSYADAIQEE